MLRQLPPSGAPTVRPQLQSRTLRLSVKAAHEGGSSTSRRELLKGVNLGDWRAGTLATVAVVSSEASNADAASAAGSPRRPPPPLQPQYDLSQAAASGSSGQAAAAGPNSCVKGAAAVRDPAVNKGCATAASVRQQLQMQGLLPPRQVAREVEVLRAATALQQAPGPLDKHRLLMALKETNAEVFYALLQGNISEMLPLVYTPTIGDACLNWGTLIPRPTGLYVSATDAGQVDALLANWPQQQVRLAVITDGERILGLGDLGAHGMGIPVGKCIVYGAAGLSPDWLLPITVDVGTDNPQLLSDPLYVGLPQKRLRGEAYMSLMQEVVTALQRRYGPSLLVHWEDVAAPNAFALLQALQAQGVPTFNDDIQCTAVVTLAAVFGALRLPGVLPLEQQRFLFFGAGQANLGVARLLVRALQARGLAEYQARSRIWLIDSKGLIYKGRPDLTPEKAAFAQDLSGPIGTALGGPNAAGRDAVKALPRWIEAIQPSALIGAAAVGGAFTQPAVEALVQSVTKAAGPYARPILFALSNPTDKSELTFEQAVTWSSGRAAFASGSPFPALQYSPGSSNQTTTAAARAAGSSSSSSTGNSSSSSRLRGNGASSSSSGGSRFLRPAQANNCLVFPGLGLGCIASGATRINDDMLLAAARAIAGLTSSEELGDDCILPDISRLPEVALAVASVVARTAAADQVSSVTVDSTRCLPELQGAAAGGAGPAAGDADQPVMCVQKLQYMA